jgi:hypothetical protein
MPIDIDLSKLSEQELRDLNRRVVERIKLLHQTRCYQHMATFNPGDNVSFVADDGRVIAGTIVRFNQKTVTLVAADGHRWRVSPSLLSRTTEADMVVEGGKLAHRPR